MVLTRTATKRVEGATGQRPLQARLKAGLLAGALAALGIAGLGAPPSQAAGPPYVPRYVQRPTRVDNQTFIAQLGSSALFMREASRYAVDHASRGPVRQFAKGLLNRSDIELKALKAYEIQRSGHARQAQLSSRQQQLLDQLRHLPVRYVNVDYPVMMSKAQEQAMHFCRAYMTSGSDPLLVRLARQWLPQLQQNYAQLLKLEKKPTH